MSHPRRSPLGLLMIVAGLALAGCASIEPQVQGLPAGSELVATSSTAMRAVTSAHIAINVTGTLAGVSIRNAEVDVDAHGTAQGSATLRQSGEGGKTDFELLKHDFYVKGPTGGYRKVAPETAGDLFDLTGILNPNRGVASMVDSVSGATVQDKETVRGVECYRITGTMTQNELGTVVPGVGSNVHATVWLATGGPHLPVRAEFVVPAVGGGGGGRIDLSISNVNTPVSVTAPA